MTIFIFTICFVLLFLTTLYRLGFIPMLWLFLFIYGWIQLPLFKVEIVQIVETMEKNSLKSLVSAIGQKTQEILEIDEIQASKIKNFFYRTLF